MATKMSAEDAIKNFGVDLLKELPLDDPIFLDMVDRAGLLGLNYKATIEAKSTRAEKVAFFKSKVLEPGADRQLPKLLDVMDECNDTKPLANKIRDATGLRKCKSMQTCHMYMHAHIYVY